MPTYDYLCTECQYEFERFHSINANIKKCPLCRGKVRRRIGSGNFILKGGGWEKDGYTKTNPIIQEPGCEAREVKHKSDFESRPRA